MKYNPNADFTYRQELMCLCLDRGISTEILNEITAPMRGCSHEEKERMAQGLIPIVESGIYDCYPRHFYHKTEWKNAIHKLYKADSISCDTVRQIIEDMLRYCSISENVMDNIFSLLCTEEHLRQMYNWVMDQLFIPEESVCIAKAKEIDATLSSNN